MNNIKLVAVDMDGTFVNDHKEYDKERFAKVLKSLKERDIKFVAASGNQIFRLRKYFEGFDDIDFIAENGALIGSDTDIMISHTFPKTSEDRILSELQELDDIKAIYCGEKAAYILKKDIELYDFMHQFFAELEVVETYDEIEDKVLKFSLVFPKDKTEFYINKLQNDFGDIAFITSSGFGSIDIIQIGRDKAHALSELGKYLNIELSEMVSFGNGGNDIEMLAETGLGVAMINSDPGVPEHADAITELDNNHSGVIDWIEKNILN